MHLPDGQRESGKNILDREDSMSKGIKVTSSGSRKEDNDGFELQNSDSRIGVGRPDLMAVGGGGGVGRTWQLMSVGKERREKNTQKDSWILALGD